MYVKFAVQGPVRLLPHCSGCHYVKAYVTYGAQRKQCYCEHPKAKEIYKKHGLKGDPTFIGFSSKYDSTPTIKTSPKWCPIRLENK